MTATIVKRAKYGLLRGGFGQIGDAKIAAMNQELASPTGNFSPCFARICYDMSARAVSPAEVVSSITERANWTDEFLRV